MKKTLLFCITLAFAAACNQEQKQEQTTTLSKRDKEVQRVDSLETEIRAAIKKQADPDISLSMHAINAYIYFAADYPQDSLAPGYLFKAAQLYEGVLHDHKSAIKNYQKVYEEYPAYKNRPMMLFHQANSYSEIQDTTNAIFNLKRFIELYPTHDFADDAEAMIAYLRMDENEMNQFFEQAQRNDQPSARK